MRVLKWLLYGAGGIVLLVVLAVVAALFIVDGTFVKNRLERKMKEERQRTLRIEGVPKVSVFPKLGFSFGKTTLSERASEKEFLSFESMSASVAVLPLLSNEVAVDAVSLTGLKVNVVRAKDGTLNFANLTGDPDEKPHETKDKAREEVKAELKELPKIRVAEIRIERAQITYHDEETGQDLAVKDLNLKTGRLEDDTPSDISFSAQVTGKKPDVDLRAELKGAASLNLAKRMFALARLDGKVRGNAGPVRGLDAQISGSLAANQPKGELNASEFSVTAKGSYEKDAFTLAIAAPQLAVTPGKAAGKAVTAELKMKGPARNVDARFKLEGLEGSAEALSIAALALDLDAAIAPNVVKGKISTPVKGNLKAREWELPKIVADLTIASPSIPQKSVTLPIRASAAANLAKQTARAEINTTFDESTIQAKLGATKLEPLVATFELKIDRLNLDRYFPAKKESNPNERLELSALKGKTATGKAEIGALTAKHVKLSNIKADIKLAGGKLEVAPHSANLYGGTIAGSFGADANGNRVTVKHTIQGVQMGPLLHDAIEQDRLEGRGNVSYDLAMAGPSIAALKRSMGGTARVDLRDGAIKGINIAEAVNDVRSIVGKGAVRANDPSKRTDFSEITASFTIKNGVAHNSDLQGKAPLFRLTGAGDVDIGNSTLNYGAKASLVATSKGQGGRDLTNLAGVTIPVRATGHLERPDITVDFAELIAKSGLGIGRALGAAGSTAGGAAGSIGDKVKGLFRR
ncbi:MAG TPA: AsmA family protein [Burkholderiales bacterium]|nr:AsmA family protein [Burkholderiales bacterium]